MGQAAGDGALEREGPDPIIFTEANAFPLGGNLMGLLL